MMEHPDVIHLEKHLQKQWNKRDIETAREVLKKERDVDENIPPALFYCRKCHIDYVPDRIYKVQADDWNTNSFFRFWKAKHKTCGTWNTRLISEKHKDKFFIKSPTLIKDRLSKKLDMIQPGESGFNMLYGRKQNRDMSEM